MLNLILKLKKGHSSGGRSEKNERMTFK